MKNILIFVKFGDFFHFFPKWKGRKYFFRNGNNPFFTVHGRNMPTLGGATILRIVLSESTSNVPDGRKNFSIKIILSKLDSLVSLNFGDAKLLFMLHQYVKH